ncbi:MAG: glycosyltransferase family 4 protein, partial [Anaerolineales bacterium]
CAAGCYPIEENSLEYFVRWDGELRVKGQTIRKPYVLLTNRHSPQKRFEYALWALKMALREVPDLSLVITGQETEYTNMLKYLIEGLRLLKSVQFVGLVSGPELETLYRQAALYVYPAPEEDFGMGIVEAMAAGTPVVAWNNGGPTVTVQNGQTGYLVQPYETDEFAEKMCILATNPALAQRMGRAGHKRARDRFSYEYHNEILELALKTAAASYDSLAKYPRRGYEQVSDPDLGYQQPSLELVMPHTSSMKKELRLQNDFASHQEFKLAETDQASDAVKPKI